MRIEACQSAFLGTADPVVADLAAAELRAVDPAVELSERDDGVLWIRSAMDATAFVAELQRREHGLDLIFLRHIQPVDYVLEGAGGEGLDTEELAGLLATFAGQFSGGHHVAVHARGSSAAFGRPNRWLRERVAGLLTERFGVLEVTKDPDVIVSLYGERRAGGWRVYLGAGSSGAHLSPWPGGRVTYRRDAGLISRAQFKLLEAAERFDFSLAPAPPERALDVGAAPGGWSWELLRRGWRVTAVDPAALAPQVAGHEGMDHRRQRVEDFAPEEHGYRLMLVDVNWDPFQTAQQVVRLVRALHPTGSALMMVKWMGQRPDLALLTRLFHRLERGFRLERAKHLFYCRRELALWMRPRTEETGTGGVPRDDL